MPLMLALSLIALQEPVQKKEQPPTAPALHRVFKPNQRDRYAVTMKISDGSGIITADFKMELKAPKKIEDETPVDVTYRDEVLNFGGIKRSVKNPGMATLHFKGDGLPAGLLAKTPVASLMLPLYTLYLPESPDATGKFTFSGHRTDDGVRLDGSGTLTVEKEAKVVVDWILTDGGKPFANMSTTAFFEPKAGRLLRSEGTFKTPNGTAEFSVVSAR